MSSPKGAAPLRVVVAGQTPPPLHGQALAIQRLVRAGFRRVEIHHVPMDFSVAIEDVGRVRVGKLARLGRAIWRVLRARFSTGARILYYPPAGPNLVPVLRDLVFLSIVRPFFPFLVLELHAGGLERMEDRLIAPLRGLFRHAYHGASLVIEKYPSPNRLPARRHLVVPNGVEDVFPRFRALPRPAGIFTVLYVGVVTPQKGIWTLLEALSLLLERGIEARAVVVGEFASKKIASEWADVVQARDLGDHVRRTGPLTGDSKWGEFHGADVFCFPSEYYETCPLAILEAMQFELPVVASDRGGTSYVVEDGETGFLIPVGDAGAAADRLEDLEGDSALRSRLGANARRSYVERYTVRAYLDAMEDALVSVAEEKPHE